MKKNWLAPQITSLDVQETFGGPILVYNVDGEVWFNGDKNEWEIPIGEHPEES